MQWFYVLCAACRGRYGASLSDRDARRAATFRISFDGEAVEVQTDRGWKSTAPTWVHEFPTFYCSNYHTFPPATYIDTLVAEAAAKAYLEAASYGVVKPKRRQDGRGWVQAPKADRDAMFDALYKLRRNAS